MGWMKACLKICYRRKEDRNKLTKSMTTTQIHKIRVSLIKTTG